MAGRRLPIWVPRSPVAIAAAVALALILVLAIVGPVLWTGEANHTNLLDSNQEASAAHWFGTDQLGRDIFYRALVASRLSVVLAVVAAAIGMVIGIPLGLLPAVLGDRVRRLVAAFIAGAIALPGLLLALFINTVIGVGIAGAVLGVGIANAPALARLAQTLSAGVATRDYVSAARMLGASRTSLLARHILPNVAEPLILTVTMSVGWCLLEISALSFLGLGVRPPSYDWGALLSEGLQGIYINPMGAIGPGAFVVVVGVAFALLGETLTGVAKRMPSLRGLTGRLAPTVCVAGEAPTMVGPTDEASLALHADRLRVEFPDADGSPLVAVNDISLDLRRGEKVGIVGESGSGKSMTALGLAQLVGYPGHVSWQELQVDGVEIATATPEQRREVLGASLALVFQDPMSALNPALRVGRQLAEVAQIHRGSPRREANELAVRQLGHVRITEPERRARQFPFEFSGGMRQRAVIAMGLMGTPKLIIADEPTTALDVTVQRQVLDLLEQLNEETGAAILLISHDIAVVTNTCSRVIVMYGGRIVEDCSSDDLLADAAHPYSRALLASVPTMSSDRTDELAVISGRPPTLADMPEGCAFAPRCPLADERCVTDLPPLVEPLPGRKVACWHPQGSLSGVTAPADEVSA